MCCSRCTRPVGARRSGHAELEPPHRRQRAVATRPTRKRRSALSSTRTASRTWRSKSRPGKAPSKRHHVRFWRALYAGDEAGRYGSARRRSTTGWRQPLYRPGHASRRARHRRRARPVVERPRRGRQGRVDLFGERRRPDVVRAERRRRSLFHRRRHRYFALVVGLRRAIEGAPALLLPAARSRRRTVLLVGCGRFGARCRRRFYPANTTVLPPIEQHPVLEELATRAGQHAALDVAPLAHQIVGRVAVADALDVLLDDRALVEIGGDEMRGRADQLDAARMRLVIGLRALEAGQERMVDVDAAPLQLGARDRRTGSACSARARRDRRRADLTISQTCASCSILVCLVTGR